MQPMQLCIFSCRSFEDTFEDTHSGEKPNKCHQCDFASSDAGNLKKHTGEKSNFASIQAGQLRA